MESLKPNPCKPLVIAGPCSAETEEQTVETCLRLAQTGMVDMLRAGVWKPRTKPGSFEGSGVQGLEWLARVKRDTKLPVAVEVATPKHVESALKYGVDAVWVGARTTVSPFAVQEISESLRGVEGVGVMVKNPVNPDIDLWSGAVERFAAAGIRFSLIGLIHRGFSYFGSRRYRNEPMWNIAFEMRDRFPEAIMLCDPSHMGGDRAFLSEISQAAADMCYDGLIIESHTDPDKALSDRAQQITPQGLEQLLRGIRWRSESIESVDFSRTLNRLREEIDQIDSEIFDLFGRRMHVSQQIGIHKRENNVAILQGRRWKYIMGRIIEQTDRLGLSREFVKAVLEAIHAESIDPQNRIMNE